MDLSLKNTEQKCCATFYQFYYLRVIIVYNYFYSQLLRASCKAAQLSTGTQSRSTDGLWVNKSIYFHRWALRLQRKQADKTRPKTINY